MKQQQYQEQQLVVVAAARLQCMVSLDLYC